MKVCVPVTADGRGEDQAVILPQGPGRQPVLGLLLMALRAGALMASPWRMAAVRAVLLS